ncbi:hypothetical protein PTI98_008814 [Pleurotus ostreatus]|nr:hypothetical protein PTI98_008814 [Pleurotus ostreatus]
MDPMASISSGYTFKHADWLSQIFIFRLSRLVSLIEEQNSILREMNSWGQRSDNRAPGVNEIASLPSVPSRSTSAWKPLLRSFAGNARPLIDRWRRNLDTTLIFVGLFSAIITAFFVESLNALPPDEASRTNALIANLTEIVIILSRNGATGLPVFEPAPPFTPNPDEVRFSFYCALALILSISTAAAAVAGHSFISSLTHSHGDSVAQLTDRYHRWSGAKSLLGPVVETIPQLLIIPVVVFALGLLDKLFSSAIQLPKVSSGLLAAAIISCTCVTLLGLAMLAAFCHALLHPLTSPFQSTFLIFLKSKLTNIFRPIQAEGEQSPDHDLSLVNCEVFHKVIQETHDDQYLNGAATAVSNMMVDSFRLRSRFLSYTPLPELELQTLLHLLSPEASIQSNLAAASIIGESGVLYYYWDTSHNRMGVDPNQRAALLRALVRATNHGNVGQRDLSTNSPFIKAMSFLVNYPSPDAWPHPLLSLLSANYFEPNEPPSVTLVDAHKETSMHAFKLLVTELTDRAKLQVKLTLLPSAVVDGAIHQIFGRSTLDPHQAIALIKSLIDKPSGGKDLLLRYTHKQESYGDHQVALSRLVRWISSSKGILQAISDMIAELPPSFFSRGSRRTRNLMLVLLSVVKPACTDGLGLCVKFLRKACASRNWGDADEDLALSIVSRYLHLLITLIDVWMEDKEKVLEYSETLCKVRKWIDDNVALVEVYQDIHIRVWQTEWVEDSQESIQQKIESAYRLIHERLEQPFLS